MTKIIISGGGTGGHIYPAIAIANALRELQPDIDILFVGAEGRMEMEKVPRAGYPIVGLPIAGIDRANLLANLSFPLKLVRSLARARALVREFRPDAAVGVGGYASGPILLAAHWLGVPYLIQEQNSYAGITNKFLAKGARKICVAYPGMEAFFPDDKIRLTGNPVRADLLDVSAKRPQALAHFGLSAKKTLLVIGGSQGARTLNESLETGIAQLLEAGYQVIWQTGKLFIDRARMAVEATGGTAVFVSDFIYEMDLAYAAADAVVSRAGALSVSELCLTGKPAIFVPLPTAAEDHQTKNALTLVHAQAGLLVRDADARQELIGAALGLLKNTDLQKKLSTNIRKLARPHAAREIAEEVLKLV
ncbi:MAG: undecaprenyldiphospho-muramoylpentapeptide beta-N-acetylglucosaminyltransferase [Cytophagaceae bacterium]|nr:undecaprenyldiphospho-muramoylpentapeptide beta-N-acetylglucosaminyltransferase [Cytophagaceae bacterium]